MTNNVVMNACGARWVLEAATGPLCNVCGFSGCFIVHLKFVQSGIECEPQLKILKKLKNRLKYLKNQKTELKCPLYHLPTVNTMSSSINTLK